MQVPKPPDNSGNVSVVKIKKIDDPEDNKKYWIKVVPARVKRKRGEPLQWENKANQDLIIFFPKAGEVFGDDSAFPNRQLNIAKGDIRPQNALTIAATTVGSIYPYVVYCVDDGVYAEGDSEPVIEIL